MNELIKKYNEDIKRGKDLLLTAEDIKIVCEYIFLNRGFSKLDSAEIAHLHRVFLFIHKSDIKDCYYEPHKIFIQCFDESRLLYSVMRSADLRSADYGFETGFFIYKTDYLNWVLDYKLSKI